MHPLRVDERFPAVAVDKHTVVRPARRKSPPPPRWSWDVEASDPARPWDGASLVVAKSKAGDREVFEGRGCLDEIHKVMRKARGDWFAHFGGGYDVPLLLNYWRPSRLVLSGSTILRADGGRELRLRDSYPWWLAPLSKVGDAVGLPKLDVDRALMERLTIAEQKVYCERDVDIVNAGADACLDFLDEHGAQHAYTAGACAAKLVKAIEVGTWHALERNRCHVDDVMSVLQSGAARGGHVACNARGVVEDVYVYDIKSSYPARYAFDPIGIGLRRADADDLSDPEAFVGVARCRWRWESRTEIPPALDQLTQCGAGECESWLVGEEIREFLARGVRVQLVEGWLPREIIPVAQTFADVLFRAKESGGAHSFFAKVFVNAWSGKTGMSPLQENFTAWKPSSWWGTDEKSIPRPVPDEARPWWYRYLTLSHDKNKLCAPFQQPLISCLTFGRARVALYHINSALQRAGFHPLYNDTDSVMVAHCPPEMMARVLRGTPIVLGEDLGQLACEGGPYRGYFLGPKAYCLTDGEGRVVKCALKGIPHKTYGDGVVDEDSAGLLWREARGDERVLGRGHFARKGNGRDVRIALFERALSREHGAARCLKDGLSTFLRGLKGTDAEGAGVWKRAPVIRTVRPSGRGKVHVTSTRWEYLTVVEVSIAKALPRLPMRLEALEEILTPEGLAVATERGLVAVDADERTLPALPREVYDLPDGRRRSRVDLDAAWDELCTAAGASTEVREEHRNRFAAEAARARVWRDVLWVVQGLRTVHPELRRLSVPSLLASPSGKVVDVTAAGRTWLWQLGPFFDVPEESEADAAQRDEDASG